MNECSNEMQCCNCLSRNTLQYCGLLVLDQVEYEMIPSEVAITISGGQSIVIKGALCYSHLDLNQELKVEVYGYLDVNAEEQIHLEGVTAAISGPLEIYVVPGPNDQLIFQAAGCYTVETGVAEVKRRPFALMASGAALLMISKEGQPMQLSLCAAIVELHFTFSHHEGGMDHPDVQPAGSQPLSVPLGLQKRTLANAGKRKRSTEEKSGVCCTVCLDSLDSILDNGRTLSAARCGHMLCSQCVLGLCDEHAACRWCQQPIVGVRRLYGVV